jgi:hypothetical protein
MSEHITHTAVSDDALRLALHSPHICADFKAVLREHWSITRIGAMTRSGDKFSVPLFERLRREWLSREPGQRLESKLAFALGWRTHQAADRRFKPVYRQLQPEHYERPASPASDVTVYHDVVVFREVFANGSTEPFDPSVVDYRMESHPAFGVVNVDRAQRLLFALWQISLLENHSFLRNEKDPARWLRLLLAGNEPFLIDARRYAAAWHNPDPDLVYRYIIEPNFYDRSDGVIALARSMQRGSPDRSIDFDAAIAQAPKASQYAQALHRGYEYVRAASDYWEHRIGEEELRRRWHIGTSHLTKTESSQ